METKTKLTTKDKISSVIVGMINEGLGMLTGYYLYANRIPTDNQVQDGYIAPSRLEMKCQDFDNIKGKETILRVDKAPYALLEVNGKPTLLPYSPNTNDYQILEKEVGK